MTLSCVAHPRTAVSRDTVRYIPLGDSYTIGQGAQKGQSWPEVLTVHLNQAGVPTELVINPARSGNSTDDVIAEELPLLEERKADFVTLLIGTNDWVRGVDEAKFHRNLALILDRVQQKLGKSGRLIILTLPHFGLSPAGPRFAMGRDIGQGLARFNEVIRVEARRRGLEVVDLFPLAEAMSTDSTFYSPDGLHPSAKGYAFWEHSIFPTAFAVLSK